MSCVCKSDESLSILAVTRWKPKAPLAPMTRKTVAIGLNSDGHRMVLLEDTSVHASSVDGSLLSQSPCSLMRRRFSFSYGRRS